ncbi:hypothetical protein ABZ341_35070 [Streptomyces sp. NPDC006173]|uniref:hypothetical protein n=1 Tax=Streptomyces sp. NPDC006173 TaxID=3155349 RepID=UPI0033CA2202
MSGARPSGHLPPADLAQHVLDGPRTPWPPEGLDHLGHCALCRDRVRAFERVGAAARDSLPHEPLVSPPARVWEAILAEVRAERTEPAPEAGRRPPS